ncbi:hypothetical protein GP486_008505 [Trichoglossum hirsutum]|uniref:Uncharacterized protein n=1 Tax=Trichoglossum hirsutum TaxID=265104 RepID=A0A9P8I766_9PEZI|nr:hypothetical protein GP486_008505 [Trichoglossum hirsutum]
MPPLQGTGPAALPPPPPQQQQQQPASNTQEQASSSPIYFHHWVPPGSQTGTGSNQPTTPSAKSSDSPFPSSKRASHFGDPDYTSSPKKRKGQGGQAAVPASSQAQPQYSSSPQFPQTTTTTTTTTASSAPGTRRRGHSRNRSDSSIRGHDSYGRPASRQRRSESGAGSQGEGGGGGSSSGSGSRAPQGGGTATTGAEDNGSKQPPLQHEARLDETHDQDAEARENGRRSG